MHSPTPTHTHPNLPKKGHTHPHPAKKGHTHPHPPTPSKKMVILTYIHPHPAKKGHTQPKNGHTDPHLTSPRTHTHPHPVKKGSHPPTHNWKKECQVSKTYYILEKYSLFIILAGVFFLKKIMYMNILNKIIFWIKMMNIFEMAFESIVCLFVFSN